MNLLLTTRVALRALAKNKMRASLTVLGVVIGIAAVTTMVSIGQSASQLVKGELEQLGTNMILVLPGSKKRGGVRQSGAPTLTSGDADSIADECPSVLAASAIVGTAGQAIYGNQNWPPNEITGVGTQYLMVRHWSLRVGAFFSDRDVASSNKVCVIGQTIVKKLFQTTNPLGETIRVRNIPLRVIGILEAKGANMVGEDQDNILLIPYTTVRKRLFGSSFDHVHAVVASARTTSGISNAENEIRQLLAERHRIPPGEPLDFQVRNTTEISDFMGMVTGTMTMLLASIAGISLIVGGVGIMNIMLVSVTERTREIGIRMAVGACSRDILQQFLVESVLLSCLGGVVGFALGVGASISITLVINHFSKGTEWPIVVSMPAAILAILFAVGVGIFFGYYPARRASRLDPIESLRYE